jgi:hypothetical protein
MKCRKAGFCVIPPFDRVEGIEVAGGGDISLISPLKTCWPTTTRMKKMGSMTSTASYYGFIYTIFGLGASHMGFMGRA